MWTALESFMLSRALDMHADLRRPKDEEWIRMLLSYLKTHIASAGEQWLVHNTSKIEYISTLVGELKDAANRLESGE
jgi:hypothetical protein